MPFPPHPPIHLPPLQVAPETFLLRSAQPAFGAPLSVNINSLLIRGREPAVVDTGTRANRSAWLADLTALVDPAVIAGASITTALQHLGRLPDVEVPPHPDQQALEAALSGGPA